ncbi:MAG: elongation factor P [Minisyncoccales bacterium]|jgi:elongation factor P
MISFNELGRGVRIVLDNDPYEIMETTHMVKGRGKSVLQAKVKNLRTGNLLSKTFRPSESFEEADTSKTSLKFLYKNRGQYFFCEDDNPKNRFSFEEQTLNPGVVFLKENETVEGMLFKGEIINITPPIKVELKVIEAPPGVKGDRAQSGTKLVRLETGAEMDVPLFIKEGDVVEINTETKEYIKRV